MYIYALLSITTMYIETLGEKFKANLKMQIEKKDN